MAIIRLPNASRSAMCAALVDRFDLGAGPGTLQIRSGAMPADPNSAATGTLLATVTLADPAFGAEVNGQAVLNDPSPVTASADGTATWFRGLDSNGVTVMDGDVTQTGGGGALTLATTALTTGLSVDVTGGTVTMPAS